MGLYCSKQLETTFSSILGNPLDITFKCDVEPQLGLLVCQHGLQVCKLLLLLLSITVVNFVQSQINCS